MIVRILTTLPTKRDLKKYLEKYEYVEIQMTFKTFIIAKYGKEYRASTKDIAWRGFKPVTDNTNFNEFYKDLRNGGEN